MDKINCLVPSNIQMMITAVRIAHQDAGGVITLTYVDGTRESRPSPDKALDAFDSWFALVGFVQDARAR